MGEQRVNLPAGLNELEGRRSSFQKMLKLLLKRDSRCKIHVWGPFFPPSQTHGDCGQTYIPSRSQARLSGFVQRASLHPGETGAIPGGVRRTCGSQGEEPNPEGPHPSSRPTSALGSAQNKWPVLGCPHWSSVPHNAEDEGSILGQGTKISHSNLRLPATTTEAHASSGPPTTTGESVGDRKILQDARDIPSAITKTQGSQINKDI